MGQNTDPIQAVFLLDINLKSWLQSHVYRLICRILCDLPLECIFDTSHSLVWQYRLLDTKQPPPILRYRIKNMLTREEIPHALHSLFTEMNQSISEESNPPTGDANWNHFMCHITQSLTDFPWMPRPATASHGAGKTKSTKKPKGSSFEFTQFLILVTCEATSEAGAQKNQPFPLAQYSLLLKEYYKKGIHVIWFQVPIIHCADSVSMGASILPCLSATYWICDSCYFSIRPSLYSLYTKMETGYLSSAHNTVISGLSESDSIQPIAWISKAAFLRLESTSSIDNIIMSRCKMFNSAKWMEEWKFHLPSSLPLCMYALDIDMERYVLIDPSLSTCSTSCRLFGYSALRMPLQDSILDKIKVGLGEYVAFDISTRSHFIPHMPEHLQRNSTDHIRSYFEKKFQERSRPVVCSSAEIQPEPKHQNTQDIFDTFFSILYESDSTVFTKAHIKTLNIIAESSMSDRFINFIKLNWCQRMSLQDQLWGHIWRKCRKEPCTLDHSDKILLIELNTAWSFFQRKDGHEKEATITQKESDLFHLKEIFKWRELQLRSICALIYYEQFPHSECSAEDVKTHIQDCMEHLGVYFALNPEQQALFYLLLCEINMPTPLKQCLEAIFHERGEPETNADTKSRTKEHNTRRSLFKSRSEGPRNDPSPAPQHQSSQVKVKRDVIVPRHTHMRKSCSNRSISAQALRSSLTSCMVLDTPTKTNRTKTRLVQTTKTESTPDTESDEDVIIVETPKRQ